VIPHHVLQRQNALMRRLDNLQSCSALPMPQELGNEHVLSGFRAEMSFLKAALTLFAWHNETLNVWTHLVAFVAFACLAVTTLLEEHHNQWTVSCWPLLVFHAGAMYVFLGSTTFHLLLCAGGRTNYERLRKLDFSGIVVVMFSMFVPFCQYSFGCSGAVHTSRLYTFVAATLATTCLTVAVLPVCQTKAFHKFRPMIYAVLGTWGIVPIVHAAMSFWQYSAVRVAVRYCVLQLSVCAAGAIFYATKWPERRRSRQGRADVADYCSSHTIFHVAVLFGLLAFHFGNKVLLQWRNEIGTCGVMV